MLRLQPCATRKHELFLGAKSSNSDDVGHIIQLGYQLQRSYVVQSFPLLFGSELPTKIVSLQWRRSNRHFG